MLLVFFVLVKPVSYVHKVLIESVGQNCDGFRLLEVNLWVEVERFYKLGVETLRLFPQNFSSSNDTVRVSSEELKHPEVLRTVGSPSLYIDAEELLITIHIACHGVDHLRFLEECWPTEHSQGLLGDFFIHTAFAKTRWQVDAHHVFVFIINS